MPAAIWVVPELRDFFSKFNVEIRTRADNETVCFVAPLGSGRHHHRAASSASTPQRTVAIDPLFGFAKRRTLMTTPVTLPEVRDAAHALLASDGVPVSRDQRLARASSRSEWWRTSSTSAATSCRCASPRPQDLDRAVVLGLGYPRGPLAMGDSLGANRILAVLESMHDFYQEPRYRPSPWLKRRAQLGVSLLTPE